MAIMALMVFSAVSFITDACAAQGSGDDAARLTVLGSASLKEGDKKSAIKYLQKAVAAEPSYPDAHFYLGKAYYIAGDFDGAAEEFDRFTDLVKQLSLEENNKAQYIGMLHDISQICFSIKKYDEFYRALNEILRSSPKDQAAMYNLGIYYYVYDRNRPKAYGYFKKAIEIDPATPSAAKARYAIEFMRTNPDSRVEPDFSFLDN